MSRFIGDPFWQADSDEGGLSGMLADPLLLSGEAGGCAGLKDPNNGPCMPASSNNAGDAAANNYLSSLLADPMSESGVAGGSGLLDGSDVTPVGWLGSSQEEAAGCNRRQSSGPICPEDEDDEGRKLEARRAKNRRTAAASRERRRNLLDSLRVRVQMLDAENTELRQSVELRKQELSLLKSIVKDLMVARGVNPANAPGMAGRGSAGSWQSGSMSPDAGGLLGTDFASGSSSGGAFGGSRRERGGGGLDAAMARQALAAYGL